MSKTSRVKFFCLQLWVGNKGKEYLLVSNVVERSSSSQAHVKRAISYRYDLHCLKIVSLNDCGGWCDVHRLIARATFGHPLGPPLSLPSVTPTHLNIVLKSLGFHCLYHSRKTLISNIQNPQQWGTSTYCLLPWQLMQWLSVMDFI